MSDAKSPRLIVLLVLTPLILLYCWLTGNWALWRKWVSLLRRYLPCP